jgi:8-oxo-dGTP pyrophosphatase MutT (NUDIX family)
MADSEPRDSEPRDPELDPRSVLPFERLPPGFAETLDDPPGEPVAARPAATIVLLREGRPGLEVLLLRRVRSSGFVPGAYVFPGGRVDADDATPALLARLEGLSPERARRRLGLAVDAVPAAAAYVIAALREAFEETGLLVGRRPDGSPPPSAALDPAVARARTRLLADEGVFADVLDELEVRMDGAALEYVAHWITPVVEPRRYDTRFFAAAVEGDSPVSLHAAEMTDALWITPAAALDRSREGRLPMVFPTLRTLEALVDYGSPRSALAAFAEREIPSILPRLVRTDTGVGLAVEE